MTRSPLIRRTTIEQHIGDDPATGLRIVHTLDIVTEISDEDDLAACDDLHAAKVALASLDVEPRRRATEWIDDQAESIAGCTPDDGAQWIWRAIEAIRYCILECGVDCGPITTAAQWREVARVYDAADVGDGAPTVIDTVTGEFVRRSDYERLAVRS